MKKTILILFVAMSIAQPLALIAFPSTAVAQSGASGCPPNWTPGTDSRSNRFCTHPTNPSAVLYIPNGTQGNQCPAGSTLGLVGNTGTNYACFNNETGATAAATGGLGSAASDVSCGTATQFLNFTTCIGRGIAAWVGGGLIYLASWILGIGGSFFNWMLLNTVANFDTVIYQTVSSGVQAAWAAFRDIANIVIIGIFTFVAIEMILGTQTFGGKRTVAKILIIAILINFSLLFARIIVESSNFVARQFYQAVQLESGAAAGGGASVSEYSAGISGRFARMMGVGGVQSNSDAIWKAAEKNKNGWIALTQGVLTAVIFIAAAAVFFYAAFLLVARAILLIFLIMTSSLAFASWLLPSSFLGGYGFEGWWRALLKNAVFGPLLVIMIWATLMVGENLSRVPGSGQIGGLLNNPADAGGVSALFGYLIILGMLYVSIKVASTFASAAGGYGYAALAAKMTGGIPLALGARGLGYMGRKTIGRYYSERSEKLDDKISKTKVAMSSLDANSPNFERRNSFLQSRINGLQDKKKSADEKASRTFSLANTEFGKKLLTKQLAVPAAIAGGGKDVVGYSDQMKKVAEEAAKSGVEVSKMSKGEQDSVKDSATAVLKQQRDLVATQIQNAKVSGESEKNSRAAELQQLESEKTAREAALANVSQNMPAGPGRDAQLDREKYRIQQAQEAINKWHKQIEKNSGIDELTKRLKSLEGQIKKTGDEAVKTGKERLKDAGEQLAMNKALEKRVDVLRPRPANAKDDQTARTARSLYRKKVGDSSEEDRILNALRNRINSGNAPTAPTQNP